MQEYLSRTHLGEKMDRIGGALLIMLLSVAAFALLWGVRLSALFSGIAMGVMLLMLRERGRRAKLHRKEKALRRRIGGEMKMEEWLLMPPRRANGEAALLLAEVFPLSVERVEAEGAVCREEKSGEKLIVFCAQLHRQEKLSARDIAAYQRVCLKYTARRGVVCGAGGMTAAGEEQALLPPAVLQVSYARMAALAGKMWPATDEQLIALGARKQRMKWGKSLCSAALSPERAPKYLIYGLLLCFLYLLLGMHAYLISALICLMLMILCRTGRFHQQPTQFL